LEICFQGLSKEADFQTTTPSQHFTKHSMPEVNASFAGCGCVGARRPHRDTHFSKSQRNRIIKNYGREQYIWGKTIMAETIGTTRFIPDESHEKRFFFSMSIACAAIAFLGFAPTYWIPLLTGKLTIHPILHLHGAVFFAWSLFLVRQTWLATTGRLVAHRRNGLIGVTLATAMTIVGLFTAINRMQWAAGLGHAEAGRAFAIVPVSTILFFAATFAVAVALTRRRDWHKRLMLVAAISVLDAPIARWFITFLGPAGPLPPGPPPVAVDLGPSLVAFLLLVAAMLFDWRKFSRPHTAYLIGAGAYALIKIVQVPISTTAAWHAVATWLMGFAA